MTLIRDWKKHLETSTTAVDANPHKEQGETIYNKKSYNQVMSHATISECSCCKTDIKKDQKRWECNNCKNEHIICVPCMSTTDMKGMALSKCLHGDYEDSKSYEMCVSPSYSWMNKN